MTAGRRLAASGCSRSRADAYEDAVTKLTLPFVSSTA
jgi:hypothetical protein